MEEKREQLAEAIKSILTASPQIEKIQSELKEDNLCVKVKITSKDGIQVLVEKNVPKWSAEWAVNCVGTGQIYSVYFEDGKEGDVLIRLNNTFTPLCKLTKAYPSKIFTTMEDAVEALYASISEFGNTRMTDDPFAYF